MANEAEKTSVTLFADDIDSRNVLTFEYEFTQPVDKDGLTTGIPRGGKMKIKVKARNDGNNQLFAWMLDKACAKDGRIEFKDPSDISKKMKEIIFTGANCVDYKEFWADIDILDKDGEKAFSHREEITITCKTIKNNDLTYTSDWD